ncbi:thioredoxin family protein [Micromonospora coerulea]|uniref:thioredoxin family protein n=1 Tax=Micromonospora coerulea TaxID=47856 RepID=UPI0019083495|nr:thioredoxin family protein [Micromonospora veneta]
MTRVLRFTATWCGPCKTLGPVADAVAARHGVPVEVVDVDGSPELAARYRVRSIPTVVLLDGSDVVYTGSGQALVTGLNAALDAR